LDLILNNLNPVVVVVVVVVVVIIIIIIISSLSQRPRGLRHVLSLAARTLGSWIQIPL
jgi:hypothetical protein